MSDSGHRILKKDIEGLEQEGNTETETSGQSEETWYIQFGEKRWYQLHKRVP